MYTFAVLPAQRASWVSKPRSSTSPSAKSTVSPAARPSNSLSSPRKFAGQAASSLPEPGRTVSNRRSGRCDLTFTSRPFKSGDFRSPLENRPTTVKAVAQMIRRCLRFTDARRSRYRSNLDGFRSSSTCRDGLRSSRRHRQLFRLGGGLNRRLNKGQGFRRYHGLHVRLRSFCSRLRLRVAPLLE